jgi:hypothetical protein
VLLRTGNTAAANEALRAARTAVPATVAARAGMVVAIRQVILTEEQLSSVARQRLFEEGSALLAEAQTLAGTREEIPVIEARWGWLSLTADRFEKDPVRAAAQRSEAELLAKRAIELHRNQAPKR